MSKYLRTLQATIEPSSIRVEQFDGREHIVLPVIALIGDSVINAMGSEGPEFVPADELAKLPLGWNDRATMIDHPAEGSAGSPKILERQSSGRIFNATFDNNKLKFESWNDPEKMTRQGGKSLDMLERIRALQAGTAGDDVIQVSVGLSVRLDGPGGVHEGKSYVGRWAEIVPDHLALLPKGVQGACNEQMGCGVRTAKDGNVDKLHRLILAFTDKGKGDNQIRRELDNLVRALSPSDFSDDLDSFEIELWGIDEVFQQSNTAISMLWTPTDTRFFRHKFNNIEGTITLSGKPEEVQPSKMQFETLGGGQPLASQGETTMCTPVELITARLLKAGHFTKDRETELLSMSEDMLKKLEVNMTPAATEPVVAPAVVPDVPQAGGVSMISVPTEEWDAMKANVEAFQADTTAQQGELVAQLKGKTTYTDGELRTLSNPVLRKLCSTVDMNDKPNKETLPPKPTDNSLLEPAVVDTTSRAARKKPDTYASLRTSPQGVN